MRLSNLVVRFLICLCLGVAVSTASAQGGGGKPKIERPASWVAVHEVDITPASQRDQISQGLYYLLSDTQVRIGNDSREIFYRFAMLVVNESGLAPAAHIEMHFDPLFQALTINSIDVIRDGQRINKLKLSDFMLLHREKELDYQVLNGELSATFTLDDIRVGDVIDYSYTINGHNPVFGGRHSGQFDLQWNVPVKQVYAAIELPHARKIQILEKNGAPKPRIVETNTIRRYEWSATDTIALSKETDTPGWYDPYARVEWSEFPGWNAVADWGHQLYANKHGGSAVKAIATKLEAEHKTVEARAIAALRFVQTEIRYLSVAIGKGSYAPSSPDAVLNRRFGDCKDKSLLLIAILEHLGVKATPALVNSWLKRGVHKSLPSPLAFNHVLVQVELPVRTLWMDPTQSLQGGTIGNIIQPDFGVALLLNNKTESLVPMITGSTNSRRSLRSIKATLDLRQGYESPAEYSVFSTFEGLAADTIRASFLVNSRDDLLKNYRNFYDGYFPGIKAIGDIVYEDDLNANRVITTETYEIPTFWMFSETRKRREGFVYAPEVEWLLRTPNSAERSLPLAQTYPMEIYQTTHILLSEKFSIVEDAQKVNDTAFEFERRVVRVQDNEFLLHDSFITKTDEIAPEAASDYFANLAKAREAASFVLTRRGEGHDGSTFIERINWVIVALALCFLGGWSWLASKAYRYDPAPQADKANKQIAGIKGGLVLLAIGLIISPFRLAFSMLDIVPSYSLDTWLALTSRSGDAYNPLWAPILIAELAGNIGSLVFIVLLLLLFFRRRTNFPNVFIAYGIYGVLLLSADIAAMNAMPKFDEKVILETTVATIRLAVWSLFWSAYLKRSVRAKSTFTKRFRKDTPLPDVESP